MFPFSLGVVRVGGKLHWLLALECDGVGLRALPPGDSTCLHSPPPLIPSPSATDSHIWHIPITTPYYTTIAVSLTDNATLMI
jgi:hypothetical protein